MSALAGRQQTRRQYGMVSIKLRPLQAEFLQTAAVKKMWRGYLRENFGRNAAKQGNKLFQEILEEIVSGMSDETIRRLAFSMMQATDATDRDRRQLSALLRRKYRR